MSTESSHYATLLPSDLDPSVPPPPAYRSSGNLFTPGVTHYPQINPYEIFSMQMMPLRHSPSAGGLLHTPGAYHAAPGVGLGLLQHSGSGPAIQHSNSGILSTGVSLGVPITRWNSHFVANLRESQKCSEIRKKNCLLCAYVDFFNMDWNEDPSFIWGRKK